LQQTLDGAPSADRSALERHWRECPTCRELLAATERLQRGLRLLTFPQPPANLTARITASVLADRRTQQGRRLRRYAGLAFLAAACFLVALLTRPFWAGRPSNGPVLNPAPTERAEKTKPEPTAPRLRDSVAEVGTAVASLTARTAAQTWEPTRKLLPSLPEPTLPKMVSPPLDSLAVPMGEAALGVREGLEPVTQSARRAVDLFLRDLPAGLTEKPGL
jgi:anti-sigma factor RsiW